MEGADRVVAEKKLRDPVCCRDSSPREPMAGMSKHGKELRSLCAP